MALRIGSVNDSSQPGGGEQFPARSAAEWAQRSASADTPWDLGAPHPELSLRLQDGRLAPPRAGAKALVPGAGLGHDALALARRGWTVTAVDVVSALHQEVAPALERVGGTFLTQSALDLEADGEFDLIWDHTFFCAIAPIEREPWGQAARRLLAPGGLYAALVFPVGKALDEGGPPFGMSGDDLESSLGPLFKSTEHVLVSRPLKRRPWREFWFTAEKSRLAPAR